MINNQESFTIGLPSPYFLYECYPSNRWIPNFCVIYVCLRSITRRLRKMNDTETCRLFPIIIIRHSSSYNSFQNYSLHTDNISLVSGLFSKQAMKSKRLTAQWDLPIYINSIWNWWVQRFYNIVLRLGQNQIVVKCSKDPVLHIISYVCGIMWT